MANEFVKKVAEEKYKFGFTTDVHTEIIDKGLNEDVIRLISSKKGEPDWLLEFRLQAFRYWQEQTLLGDISACLKSIIKPFPTMLTQRKRRTSRKTRKLTLS